MNNKKIEDYLSNEIIRIIKVYFDEKVSNAEQTFEYHEEDEDVLTGALGQELITKNPITYSNKNRKYSLTISSRKIRGRGQNAPEKITGADGIFKISIIRDNQEVLKKGLLFQSKKNWKNQDKNLIKQCNNMINHVGSAIVINYTRNGYEAYDAKDVISFNGRRKELLEENKKLTLSNLLGKKFLNCIIGEIGLDYDKESEEFLKNSFTNSTEIKTEVHIT